MGWQEHGCIRRGIVTNSLGLLNLFCVIKQILFEAILSEKELLDAALCRQHKVSRFVAAEADRVMFWSKLMVEVCDINRAKLAVEKKTGQESTVAQIPVLLKHACCHE